MTARQLARQKHLRSSFFFVCNSQEAQATRRQTMRTCCKSAV